MKTRPYEARLSTSIPDNFDIMKVTAITTAGDIISAGMIYTVSANAVAGSALPDVDAPVETTNHIASADITLIDGDEAKLLGWKRNYSYIVVYEPNFASNLTDVVVSGAGKDMSNINDFTIYDQIANFNQISIPVASTSMVVVASY
jgi:hypothetical protein